MRSRPASTAVLLGVAAALAAATPRAAWAQPRDGVTVRLDAIDAAPARATPIRPQPIVPLRAGSRAPASGFALQGLATSGFATPGLARSGLAQSGFARTGLATPGMAASGLATPDLAMSGLALPGLAATGRPIRGRPSRAAAARAVPAHALPAHALPAHALPAGGAFMDEGSSWIAPAELPRLAIEAPPGGLQCVPYARMVSGIGIRGDAWTWWDKASGTYARGNHPEPGAVLSFPGIERMPLGHVAVVTHVLAPRKILIEHANWPTAEAQHGAISTEIVAVDTSPANDWTEVRVQFGKGGPLGSAYPTHGFIYGWSETGVRIARPRFSLDYALWSPLAPSWRMIDICERTVHPSSA